jgi:hypothetical protein
VRVFFRVWVKNRGGWEGEKKRKRWEERGWLKREGEALFGKDSLLP